MNGWESAYNSSCSVGDTQRMVFDALNELSDARPRRSISVSTKDIYFCGITIDNHTILLVSAISFLIFVVSEIIGALASGSLSLLGDAAAMSVDVFTYFCNLYSEYAKRKYGKLDNTTRFILEVGIPSFSLSALLGVTVWITYDALDVILHPENEKVNVAFLFGFASGNALVDIICSVLFYLRRRDVLKNSLEYNHSHNTTNSINSNNSNNNSHNGDINPITSVLITSEEQFQEYSEQDKDKIQDNIESGSISQSQNNDKNINLNMASALTHVSGDSLRTSSVFIAAVVATTTKYSGAICDAWAAVVVTITIIFIIIPLAYEIYHHAKTFMK